MSFPLNRTMLIRHARPKEASDAPNVSTIRIIIILEGETLMSVEAIIRVIERIMASRDRRAMSRCFRCRTMVKMVIRVVTGRRKVSGRDIAKGQGASLIYKIRVL